MKIAPIVEGHGEVPSVPILLRRIAWELLKEPFIDVKPPIRVPRSQLVKKEHLERAIGLALLKLPEAKVKGSGAAIMVLLDADGDPPCKVGPELQAVAEHSRPSADIFCVVANLEYETWFVAAAESLVNHGLSLAKDEVISDEPEAHFMRKGWVEQHMLDQRSGYSPTVDQPRFTKAMDLQLCRRRSPSFDKLCRELEKRHATPMSGTA